jgi:hypothetical protein
MEGLRIVVAARTARAAAEAKLQRCRWRFDDVTHRVV